MKKLFILSLLILSACSPSEMDYKSNVPLLEDRVALESKAAEISTELPSEINLNIPFFSQAPDCDWGEPWQEACEEASAVLAYYYATDQELNKEQFKKEILSLVDWQMENFGDYEHTSIEQTVEMMSSNFQISNFKFQILKNPSIQTIKQELTKGYPIIAPFAGRQLGNPFYSGEGPYYHVMVIKGYDEKNFITNDVGTRRGENFIYPYETIMSAMHDWHDEDINLGERRIIVVRPISVDEEKMEK